MDLTQIRALTLLSQLLCARSMVLPAEHQREALTAGCGGGGSAVDTGTQGQPTWYSDSGWQRQVNYGVESGGLIRGDAVLETTETPCRIIPVTDNPAAFRTVSTVTSPSPVQPPIISVHPQLPSHPHTPIQPQHLPRPNIPAHPQHPPCPNTPIQPQLPSRSNTPVHPHSPPHSNTPVYPQLPPRPNTPILPQPPPHSKNPVHPHLPPSLHTPLQPQPLPGAIIRLQPQPLPGSIILVQPQPLPGTIISVQPQTFPGAIISIHPQLPTGANIPVHSQPLPAPLFPIPARSPYNVFFILPAERGHDTTNTLPKGTVLVGSGGQLITDRRFPGPGRRIGVYGGTGQTHKPHSGVRVVLSGSSEETKT